MATKTTDTTTDTTTASTIDTTTASTAPAVSPPLHLGTRVTVRLVAGQLINNETSLPFVVGEDTPQTVTTTLLARVRDGDLVVVA